MAEKRGAEEVPAAEGQPVAKMAKVDCMPAAKSEERTYKYTLQSGAFGNKGLKAVLEGLAFCCSLCVCARVSICVFAMLHSDRTRGRRLFSRVLHLNTHVHARTRSHTDVELQIPDLGEHCQQSTLAGVRSAFYAVFDGHAGKNAAEFCAEHMYETTLFLVVVDKHTDRGCCRGLTLPRTPHTGPQL
jgi:hypothetical protein